MAKYNILNRLPQFVTKLAKSSVKPQSGVVRRNDSYAGKIAPKAVSRARADIASWQSALRAADSTDNPRRARLVNLQNDIMLDAHLSSQIELRFQSLLSIPFVLKRDKEIDPNATALLTKGQFKTRLDRYMLESVMYGNSLVELTTDKDGCIDVALLPRTNVVPEQGVLLLNQDDSRGIHYRELHEYGTWILEFGSRNDYGLLNKAIPHVLFMRFAQSCWSELCEIYGIPPRVMKTNTQDTQMLDRAEQMMRDMGAAAWFIIDDSEHFEFAKGADTNGDVYRNLMSVCKEAISMLITGAVIGQDTVNGNRSKEESSIGLFDKIVMADKRIMESWYNHIVIPALVRIGFLPDGLTYELQQEEDLEKLWSQTHQALEYFEVEPTWIKSKFGIEVTGKREVAPTAQTLSSDFFA